MKQLVAILALLFCILLVTFSAPALEAARTGVSIWWNTLLPTLFPFFVGVALMEHSGALHSIARLCLPISKRLRISNYALPLLCFGGMSGYPSGARLSGLLQKNGVISDEEASRLGTVCNLCSPMFLAGAVAGGMFMDTALFLPLALGHYGGAIIVAVFGRLLFPAAHAAPKKLQKQAAPVPLYKALPKTIAEGMNDSSKVGGTVIFFLVIAELCKQTGVFGWIGAPVDFLFRHVGGGSPTPGILMGLLEMTGGCHLIVQAQLPLLYAIPICAFLVSFGRLSVMVQTMAFLPLEKPWRYLLTKAIHGILAAIIAYMVLAGRAGSLEVFAPSQTPYVNNALTGAALCFASTLGIATAFFISLFFGKPRKKLT